VIAAFISSIPLTIGLSRKELALVKLFIFPLAGRCFIGSLLSHESFPKLKRHGDILGYCLFSSIIGLTFMNEKYSNPLEGAVRSYGHFTPSELKLISAFNLF
jgi:hypothetical protein